MHTHTHSYILWFYWAKSVPHKVITVILNLTKFWKSWKLAKLQIHNWLLAIIFEWLIPEVKWKENNGNHLGTEFWSWKWIAGVFRSTTSCFSSCAANAKSVTSISLYLHSLKMCIHIKTQSPSLAGATSRPPLHQNSQFNNRSIFNFKKLKIMT